MQFPVVCVGFLHRLQIQILLLHLGWALFCTHLLSWDTSSNFFCVSRCHLFCLARFPGRDLDRVSLISGVATYLWCLAVTFLGTDPWYLNDQLTFQSAVCFGFFAWLGSGPWEPPQVRQRCSALLGFHVVFVRGWSPVAAFFTVVDRFTKGIMAIWLLRSDIYVFYAW
jgi:hypothetical protein